MNMGLILFFIVIIIRTFIRFYWRIWFELRLGFGDMVCFWEYLLWTRRVDFCIYSIRLMCKRCWVLNCLAMLMIGCSLMTMIRTMWKDEQRLYLTLQSFQIMKLLFFFFLISNEVACFIEMDLYTYSWCLHVLGLALPMQCLLVLDYRISTLYNVHN